MFMDVVTNFAPSGSKAFYPTQADGLERGPVRLRSALQFSLNIPAIKAGHHQRRHHEFNRFKDFGLTFPSGTAPVVSESIGTLDTHPIQMISAYGAIANGGVLMPRHTIVKVPDAHGKRRLAARHHQDDGRPHHRPGDAYIMTDILAGNTIRSVNPFWGKWRITDGVTGSKVRPAAYKTGTTSDNQDVHAYGFLAPPTNQKLPALVAGVWMGNSDNSPNDGKLSLDTSAPLWSAILSDVSKGMPIEGFGRIKPKNLTTATVDAFTGMKPGPSTRKTVRRAVHPGHRAHARGQRRRDRGRRPGDRPEWREGCAGPMVTQTFLDFSNVESGFRSWQRADTAWQARAARGAGVVGRTQGHAHRLPLRQRILPVRRVVGRQFAPTKNCKTRAAAAPTPCMLDRPVQPVPAAPPSPARRRRRRPGSGPRLRAMAAGTTARCPGPRAGRSSRRRRPRRARRRGSSSRAGGRPAAPATASRSAPVPRPWMIEHLVETGQRRVVEVARQRLERLVDPRAAQVE